MVRQIILASLIALAVSACASTSHVLVGVARPPISATEVQVYLRPPPAFQDIATLSASADSAFGTGGPASANKVLARLKEEAAKLGANGIILEGMADRQTASLGGGTGSSSYSGNTAVGVGVGGSFGIFKKTGHARAIFVPPGSAPPPPPGAPTRQPPGVPQPPPSMPQPPPSMPQPPPSAPSQ